MAVKRLTDRQHTKGKYTKSEEGYKKNKKNICTVFQTLVNIQEPHDPPQLSCEVPE